MNQQTKIVLDYIIKLSCCAEMNGNFVVSKKDDKFVGIDIRFEPPLNLSDFPSIIEVMKIKGV